MLVRDYPVKVNNVHLNLVQSGNNGLSGVNVVSPVELAQPIVSVNVQPESWQIVSAILFNRNHASMPFVQLILHELHSHHHKSQIALPLLLLAIKSV